MQRAQEARRLAQDRDDARVRLHLGDRAGRRARPQVQRRGLTDPLAGRPRREQRQVLLERVGSADRPAWRRANVQLRREEPRLLSVGHVDLRVAPQHLIQRSRAALGVADDEEVGNPRRHPYEQPPYSLPDPTLLAHPADAPHPSQAGSTRPSPDASRRRAARRSGSRRCRSRRSSAVSNATSRPSTITITRSQMSSVDMRCATMNSVSSCLSAVSDSWISASDCGSSALVGSSSTSTSGRAASARARQMRCCWPPETASARGPTIVS